MGLSEWKIVVICLNSILLLYFGASGKSGSFGSRQVGHFRPRINFITTPVPPPWTLLTTVDHNSQPLWPYVSLERIKKLNTAPLFLRDTNFCLIFLLFFLLFLFSPPTLYIFSYANLPLPFVHVCKCIGDLHL